MKKLFALPLAALIVAACSESTSPESAADLSPSYAKGGTPGKPGGGGGGGGGSEVAGNLTNLTFNFEGNILASGLGGGAFVTENSEDPTDASAAALAVAGSIPVQSSYTAGGSGFLGRFATIATQAVLNVPGSGSKYSLSFDLYIIGSWDGKGKQAQQGSFLPNIFTVAYRCGAGTAGAVVPIFETTFSNQLTVQQDYPLGAFDGGGAKAGTGSFATDALGYKDRPDLSHTPAFRSFGDAIYKMTFTNSNPCAGQQISFIFKSLNPYEQNTYDESWAIDNVVIKTDA